VRHGESHPPVAPDVDGHPCLALGRDGRLKFDLDLHYACAAVYPAYEIVQRVSHQPETKDFANGLFCAPQAQQPIATLLPGAIFQQGHFGGDEPAFRQTLMAFKLGGDVDAYPVTGFGAASATELFPQCEIDTETQAPVFGSAVQWTWGCPCSFGSTLMVSRAAAIL